MTAMLRSGQCRLIICRCLSGFWLDSVWVGDQTLADFEPTARGSRRKKTAGTALLQSMVTRMAADRLLVSHLSAGSASHTAGNVAGSSGFAGQCSHIDDTLDRLASVV